MLGLIVLAVLHQFNTHARSAVNPEEMDIESQ